MILINKLGSSWRSGFKKVTEIYATDRKKNKRKKEKHTLLSTNQSVRFCILWELLHTIFTSQMTRLKEKCEVSFKIRCYLASFLY